MEDRADSGGAPEPAPVAAWLAELEAAEDFAAHIIHHRQMEEQGADWADLARPPCPVLADALTVTGFARLYRHQAQAVDLIRAGSDVLVSTPTASGKSLIYNIPVFDRILRDPFSRALYVFPLKALAQDQLRAVNELAGALPAPLRPAAAIVDGDTSGHQRRKLRQHPVNIMMTNPDMLHLSLLGHHERWASFWPGLRYIILDEVHTLRGVFGSHMAWVLRRLLRICRLYGSEPQFVMSSATVGNPAELARQLTGRPAAVVTESGAPRGRRHFLFYNPLHSAAHAACRLLEQALRRGLRTIVYTQSRKMAELISIWTRTRLGDLRERLSPYRSGFLAEERRQIETKLASGQLFGVVSTSALELGIDIGELDVCLMVGYPGTVMTTWQRGGRVGRRQRESLVVLIGGEDALDQHFMRNPEDFFGREVERAVLNPANPVIAAQHLVCAAAETPLAAGEPLLADPAVMAAVRDLEAGGRLLRGRDGDRWHTMRTAPHREVSLRGGGGNFLIYTEDEHRLVGQIDGHRCLRECHPGAVYLHRTTTWVVSGLDIEGREVLASPRKVHFFTRAMAEKHTEILHVEATKKVGGATVSLGRLRVTDRVTGFQKRLVRGQKLIATEPLDLPPSVFETEGLWFEIPERLQAEAEGRLLHFMGGIHALEHAAIGIFPLLVLCDRNDIGGISQPAHPQLSRAAVFIYDGHPGGIGLCREVFARAGDLMRSTLNAIASCRCDTGCPSCVHSPKCGSGNRPIDKEAALFLARELQSEKAGGRVVVLRPAGHQPARAPAVSPARTQTGPEPTVHYRVFDLETQRSAQEVGGWQYAARMGVSLAVVYDSREDAWQVYGENEVDRLLAALAGCDLVVGFNSRRFDYQVLAAYGGPSPGRLPTLDLLEEVQRHLGYRLSLDNLAEHSLGGRKSGDGLMALRLYREGRLDELASYCRRDVELTRDLFLFGWRHRHLLFANKAGQVVRCPVDYNIRIGNGGGKRSAFPAGEVKG
ncbi:MAG: DEAD/DEAH box helicase [Thermodesulfobacteriota bacterium]